MDSTVVVIDFETTGLSPDEGARATEIAAVVLDRGRVVARYQSLMNAGVHVPRFIEELTGITNAMVREAPPAKEVMAAFARFVGDLPLVAHNASFDRKFLDAELARIRQRRRQEVACSMRVARRLYPDAPNHKLGTLVDYAGVRVTGRHHRALADAEMAAGLWTRMEEDLLRAYRLRQVPHELMCRLQTVRRDGLADFMEGYKRRCGP